MWNPPSTLKIYLRHLCVCGGGGPFSRFSHGILVPVGKEWQRESAVFTCTILYMQKKVKGTVPQDAQNHLSLIPLKSIFTAITISTKSPPPPTEWRRKSADGCRATFSLQTQFQRKRKSLVFFQSINFLCPRVSNKIVFITYFHDVVMHAQVALCSIKRIILNTNCQKYCKYCERSAVYNLKVHKIEIFFGFDFEICIISLLVMSKY